MAIGPIWLAISDLEPPEYCLATLEDAAHGRLLSNGRGVRLALLRAGAGRYRPSADANQGGVGERI
jgi:hypothetical protein